jgi:hypothetical protein
MFFLYIYIHTHTYIYTHTHTDQQVHLPRTVPCCIFRRNDCNYNTRNFRSTCVHEAAIPYYFIYIYIYTHNHRQASKSIYHARHFVYRYGEMIATTMHENFDPLAPSSRQVHVTLYIYIYVHTPTYIYTHTGQQVHLLFTAPCLHLRRNDCHSHARDYRSTCAPKASSSY